MSAWPESSLQEHKPNDWIIEWPKERAERIDSFHHSPLGIHFPSSLLSAFFFVSLPPFLPSFLSSASLTSRSFLSFGLFPIMSHPLLFQSCCLTLYPSFSASPSLPQTHKRLWVYWPVVVWSSVIICTNARPETGDWPCSLLLVASESVSWIIPSEDWIAFLL